MGKNISAMKRIECRMVKGYELRIIGLTFCAVSPISFCPPLELSPDISFLLFAAGMICVMLGVAQKRRAEANGGADQYVLVAIPLAMFLLSVLICLTWLI